MGDLGVIVLFGSGEIATLPLKIYQLMGSIEWMKLGFCSTFVFSSIGSFALFDKLGRTL